MEHLDAQLSMNRLLLSQKELEKLIKETTTEETTHSQNADINSYPGYSYYDSEVKRLRGLITSKQLGVESVVKAYKSKRESQIETLKHSIIKMSLQIKTLEEEITNYETSCQSTASTIEDNHSRQIQVYIGKMEKIREVIGIPTSLAYRRKKTRIEELNALILEQTDEFNRANVYETAKLKKKRIQLLEAERVKEEEKERKEKATLLEAWERDQAAAREVKRQRWAAKGLETETATNFEPEPEFDLATPAGRNAKKVYDRKKVEAKSVKE